MAGRELSSAGVNCSPLAGLFVGPISVRIGRMLAISCEGSGVEIREETDRGRKKLGGAGVERQPRL